MRRCTDRRRLREQRMLDERWHPWLFVLTVFGVVDAAVGGQFLVMVVLIGVAIWLLVR